MIARLLARMMSEKQRIGFIFNMLVECAWVDTGKAVTITMVVDDLAAKEILVEKVDDGVFLGRLGEPK
jgi:hypothetical protein